MSVCDTPLMRSADHRSSEIRYRRDDAAPRVRAGGRSATTAVLAERAPVEDGHHLGQDVIGAEHDVLVAVPEYEIPADDRPVVPAPVASSGSPVRVISIAVDLHHQEALEEEVDVTDAVEPDLFLHQDPGTKKQDAGHHLECGVRSAGDEIQRGPRRSVPVAPQSVEKERPGRVPATKGALDHHGRLHRREAVQNMDQYVDPPDDG